MSIFRKLFGRGAKGETEAAPKPPHREPEPQPKPVHITEISPQELQAQLNNGHNLLVVDMRSQWEYHAGHIPGAVNMFIQEIPARFQELPKDRTIVFQCWHGNTSVGASGFLIENCWPVSNVASLSGGMAGWVQVHGQESLEKG
jgi:rhodanese-related sulfurtransferase